MWVQGEGRVHVWIVGEEATYVCGEGVGMFGEGNISDGPNDTHTTVHIY